MLNWFKNQGPLPLQVELSGSHDHGPCNCCGNMSRCVWGFVSTSQAILAAYFVHWTLGSVKIHGANFDLILGRHGENTTSQDRYLVSLAFRLAEGRPEFMVIDSQERPAASDNHLIGRALQRADVIGKAVAKEAFAVVDAIWLQDSRIAELHGTGPKNWQAQ